MISGVSLKGASALLVPLQEIDGALVPIALAIKGRYNRLGSIDGIEADANTSAVLKFFLDRLASGEFVVDADYLRKEKLFPIATIEQLLQAFERNINDHSQAALLNRRPVVFALIGNSIWQSIVEAETLRILPLETVLGSNSVATQIYAKGAYPVRDSVAELDCISNFLNSRNLPWQSAGDPGQHYPDDMQAFLNAAKEKFRDSEMLLAGLRAYEGEVQELLRQR
jgi:hypothetical protein